MGDTVSDVGDFNISFASADGLSTASVTGVAGPRILITQVSYGICFHGTMTPMMTVMTTSTLIEYLLDPVIHVVALAIVD